MLARLGQREWAIIAIVAALLVGALLYYLMVRPLKQQIPLLNDEISELTIERDRGRAAQRALPQLRAAIAQLEAERQEFLRQLPPQEQLNQVFALLSQRAKENGVVLKNFKRSMSASNVPSVWSTNIALQVESPFSELYGFLKRLESLQRFSTISGLTLTVGSDANSNLNPSLTTSLTMTVFTYKEAEPQTPQGSATPGKTSGQTPGGRP